MAQDKQIVGDDVKGLGRLQITLHKASELYDTQTIGKQDPMAIMSFRGQQYRTKVSKDTGREALWEQSFELEIRRLDEAIGVQVVAHGTIMNTNIGLVYLSVEDFIKNPLPRWHRLGREMKQSTDAGLIQVSTHFTAYERLGHKVEKEDAPYVAPTIKIPGQPAPPPPPPPVITAPDGFSSTYDEINLNAHTAANLSGSWRVYTKDAEGKERSYSLELVHYPDNTIEGHGEAAHMTFKIEGHVNGSALEYKESWAGLGVDMVHAEIKEGGLMFEALNGDTRFTTVARKINAISKETHPEFFRPYYDMSGKWRIYVEYKNGKKISYSLELKQEEDGTLSGGGQAGNNPYTVQGKLEKNVIKYKEIWGGNLGEDQVLAEINPSGTYFVCKTQHAAVQEAKREDAMMENDKKKYYLPYH